MKVFSLRASVSKSFLPLIMYLFSVQTNAQIDLNYSVLNGPVSELDTTYRKTGEYMVSGRNDQGKFEVYYGRNGEKTSEYLIDSLSGKIQYIRSMWPEEVLSISVIADLRRKYETTIALDQNENLKYITTSDRLTGYNTAFDTSGRLSSFRWGPEEYDDNLGTYYMIDSLSNTYQYEYQENAILAITSNLQNGVNQRIEFYSSGVTFKVYSVNERGIPIGSYVEYFENGEIRTKGQYSTHAIKEKIPIGLWIWFNPDGTIEKTLEY